jgi:uncharacterized protein (TIGR02147 family)
MKTAARPSPYDYKEYREYLAALFAWLKENNMSLRRLASKLDVSVSLLSSIVQGRRNLTRAHIENWKRHLDWDESEVSFLEKMIHFQDGDEREQKADAFKKIIRFKRYQERSTREVVTWQYLEKWWVVVIREMSALKEFQFNAEWVQARLRYPVAVTEIRKALQFLKDHKLLAGQGEFTRLDCHGGVYKLALAQFHGQMLERASDSIYKATTEERHILGHTYRLNPKKLAQLKRIMDKALEDMAALEDESDNEGEVFHVALTAVPMTKKGKV